MTHLLGSIVVGIIDGGALFLIVIIIMALWGYAFGRGGNGRR